MGYLVGNIKNLRWHPIHKILYRLIFDTIFCRRVENIMSYQNENFQSFLMSQLINMIFNLFFP